jgi:predicted RNA-binding protein YlxR (DUF448 family)
MCIVTKERKPKKELMRLVRIDDSIQVDPKGKLRGRGANITMDVKILQEAIEKGVLERALKLKRKLTNEEKKSLKSDFIDAVEEKKFRPGNKPVVIKVSKEEMKKLES